MQGNLTEIFGMPTISRVLKLDIFSFLEFQPLWMELGNTFMRCTPYCSYSRRFEKDHGSLNKSGVPRVRTDYKFF